MKWEVPPQSDREMSRRPRRVPVRLLLAEGDGTVRGFMALLLRRQGWQVTAVADGLEALRAWKAANRPFDVTILDMHMPMLGGYEAYRQIREQHPNLRVLFISDAAGEAQDRLVREGLPFLAQPFSADGLIDAVQRLLSSATSASPEAHLSFEPDAPPDD